MNDTSHESVAPKMRRQFTASEKLRLVKAANAALASGERGALGALLRKEVIYSSQLATWREQLGANGEAGLTSRRPGRKPKLGATDRALLAATKQNETLERKLRVANALIALQKNDRERRRIFQVARPVGQKLLVVT
jgi:transposase-like protein